MRRLPVYILIQTSGAMRGEPIEAIKVGLETLVASLRQDPFALESVHLSVITFNRSPQQILPLTELESLQIPAIPQPEAAGTHLGEALEFICKKVDSEVILSTPERKGDWMPLLFIMCDGRASDAQVFQRTVPILKQKHCFKSAILPNGLLQHLCILLLWAIQTSHGNVIMMGKTITILTSP